MCPYSGTPRIRTDIHSCGNDNEWEQNFASAFDEDNAKKSKKLKVKILPSTLANDQFKVKPEKFDESECESPSTSTSELVNEIKIEVKTEP